MIFNCLLVCRTFIYVCTYMFFCNYNAFLLTESLCRIVSNTVKLKISGYYQGYVYSARSLNALKPGTFYVHYYLASHNECRIYQAIPL